MMNESVEITSLCSVWTDSNNKIWLSRLADLYEGELVQPDIDDTAPKYFGNRDKLYHTSGPIEDGTIGIWHWRASPRDTDFLKDFISTEYQNTLRPVRFIMLRQVSSFEQLCTQLSDGISRHKYPCDTVFCYEDKPGRYNGLLCKQSELVLEDKIYLKKNIYSLPICRFTDNEILTIKNSLRFVKKVPFVPSEERFTIGNTNEILRSVILDRMTWPLYKQCIGRTKAEWRDCKILFERACGDSLYESIMKKIGCTSKEATELVEAFKDRANELISQNDIDSDVLAQIALNNEDLRTQCEAVVEQRWRADHEMEIVKAQNESVQIVHRADDIVRNYKAQFEQLKEEKEAVFAEKEKILSEISEAQNRLDKLLRDIEEHEKLGDETVQAMHKKINAAQKDMASFIAEISTFLPQQFTQSSDSTIRSNGQHWIFAHDASNPNSQDSVDCMDWKETFELLSDNLMAAGVRQQFVAILAAFLYSSYLNGMHLLLVGPNALALSNALSMAVTGKPVSILKCFGEPTSESILEYEQAEIVAIENPFNPEWINRMPQIDKHKFVIWLHPFIDDLLIEPHGLYNFVYPVFTECFIDQVPSLENIQAGNITEKYEHFCYKDHYRAKMGNIKKLKVGKLIINKIQKTLSDAKCMVSVSDVSMEYMFAILPFSVLFEKQALLSDLLVNEKNLPSEIQAEILRYIDE